MNCSSCGAETFMKSKHRRSVQAINTRNLLQSVSDNYFMEETKKERTEKQSPSSAANEFYTRDIVCMCACHCMRQTNRAY